MALSNEQCAFNCLDAAGHRENSPLVLFKRQMTASRGHAFIHGFIKLRGLTERDRELPQQGMAVRQDALRRVRHPAVDDHLCRLPLTLPHRSQPLRHAQPPRGRGKGRLHREACPTASGRRVGSWGHSCHVAKSPWGKYY